MHFVQAKSILSRSNGMNLYRDCTHGCIYCDSPSACCGFDHPFEDIEGKENAPLLLKQALKARRKRCMIGTDPHFEPPGCVPEKFIPGRKKENRYEPQ